MRIEEADANCVDQLATVQQDAELTEGIESWKTYFSGKYRLVGTLREWVREEPDLAATARRCLERNGCRPTVTTLPSGVQ